MTAIKPVFMTLVLAVHVFVQNYYTKFHENPTSCSVADTRSQMNIRTCFPIDTFFFLLVKNTYKKIKLSLRTPINRKEDLLKTS